MVLGMEDILSSSRRKFEFQVLVMNMITWMRAQVTAAREKNKVCNGANNGAEYYAKGEARNSSN